MVATATRTLKYVRPWVADYQRSGIFHDKRYGVIEATTKSGKTIGCMIWLAEQAMQGRAGRNYWWVAPTVSQAKIAYRRLKRGLPREVYQFNDSELTMTLANDAVMSFKTAEKPDNLYGEDVYAAVIDEASRCREESWHAIRSTLTHTQGPLRIIGNVKGRKNWAYHLARRAQSGDPSMHYAKITAYDAIDAGILDAAEVEDARQQLPDAVFKELYLAEPSDDGGNPFGLGAIERCISDGFAAGPAKAWAWDLAKSTDWTVGIGLNKDGYVCRFERWNKTALPPGATGDYWDATEKLIVQFTAGCAALVESNGIGDPVFEGIQRRAAAIGQQNFAPFYTSSTSKQQIMEGLAVAIQQLQVHYPNNEIRNELEEFEYVFTRTGVKYSAPDGMHDDCVMALAMAWALFDATPAPEGVYVYDERVAISPF